MSTNKLVIANPFSDEQMRLLGEFEREYGIEHQIVSALETTRRTTTEEEYESKSKYNNEVDIVLLEIENDKVTDCCNIQGARDIKTCSIFFAPIKQRKSRSIINMSTDYALNVLGMEEVFVSIDSTDKYMMSNLETRNFENLGEENGYITYLKEKQDQTVQSSFIQLH